MGINMWPSTHHPVCTHPLATPSNSDVVADDEPTTPECPQIDWGNDKIELREPDVSQKWDIYNTSKQPRKN